MLLGVLGGLGPLATVYFMDLLVKMTDANTDQEHIPTLIMNDAEIPDRTAYILGQSNESPLPKMKQNAKLLEKCGCDYIVIPCNTAHYFYDEVQSEVGVPIINILDETIKYAAEKNPGMKKVGVLATEGTMRSGSYKKYIEKYGLTEIIPEEDDIASLMNIIYGQVKAGRQVDIVEFNRLIMNLVRRGSDVVILGCTELSIINRDFGLTRTNSNIIDSMEVLAMASILKCGKKIKL